MTTKTSRIDGTLVPFDLTFRPNAHGANSYEVVSRSGAVLAHGITDINTARLFATAPKVLAALRSTNYFIDHHVGVLLDDALSEGWVDDDQIDEVRHRAQADESLDEILEAPDLRAEGLGVLELLVDSVGWSNAEKLAYTADGSYPVRPADPPQLSLFPSAAD